MKISKKDALMWFEFFAALPPEEELLPLCDMVLLMTVNPGFAGQKLVPQTLQKITRLRKMLDESGYAHVRIEVDGNVSFENAVKMRAAGADRCGVSATEAIMQEAEKRYAEGTLGE